MSNDHRNYGSKTGRTERGTFARGNPGKPKGARHKTTLAVESLLDGEAEGLTRKAVELALKGDVTALRLCLDRILPPRRDRPVSFKMPVIGSAADGAKLIAAILAAVAAGEITPAEGMEISALVEVYLHGLEISEFEARLKALEEAKKQ